MAKCKSCSRDAIPDRVRCLVCTQRRKAEWRKHYAKNPNKHVARTKAYREAHPNSRDGEGKRYYAKHKERMLESSKRYYYANWDKAKAYKQAWRARNWDTVKLDHLRYWHERRARLQNVDVGTFTKEAWSELIERQGNLCIDCKQSRKLTIGHAIPLSRGGTHDMSNIIAQCQPCNSKQGTTIHESARK